MTYRLLTLQQWDMVEYRCETRRREKIRNVFGYDCPLACPTLDDWVEEALKVWRHKKGWLTGFLAANEN